MRRAGQKLRGIMSQWGRGWVWVLENEDQAKTNNPRNVVTPVSTTNNNVNLIISFVTLMSSTALLNTLIK